MPAKSKKGEKLIADVSETAQDGPQQGLVVTEDMSIVHSMVSPQQALQNWKDYQELCKAILAPEDLQEISMYAAGKGTVKKVFKKKSAWRKLATAFNLSVEVLKEERKEYPATPTNATAYFVIEVTARATAMNGRRMDGTGSCASNERGFSKLEHDVRATAETRAKNRAIADMIGGGEVSAEELLQMEENQKQKCPRNHEELPQKEVSSEGKNKGRPYQKCPSCTFFRWLDEPSS